jgi:hypothetical protein
VDGDLTVENLRRIVLNSDAKYRTLSLMKLQGLMGSKELCYVNVQYREVILEHVLRNDGEFVLRLPGRKGGDPYYTVLSTHGDWCKEFKAYMKVTDNDFGKALFLNDFGNPLTPYNISSYFREHAFRCGVVKRFTPKCVHCGFETVRMHKRIKGKITIIYKCKRCMKWFHADSLDGNYGKCFRYGVNPHEERDLGKTRFTSSGADRVVADFVMGHNIDPNNYEKWMKYGESYPLQEYRKALPFLNILSCDPDKVDKSQVDLKFEGQKAQIELLQNQLAVVNRKLEAKEEIDGLLSEGDVTRKFKKFLQTL